MERKIKCCLCDNDIILNDFNNHLSICLEDAYINENLLTTLYKKIFYPEKDYKLTEKELKIINEHADLYFHHYQKFLEQYNMDYNIDDLKELIYNFINNNNNVNILFSIRCVNCGENYNTDLFINHINNCLLNVDLINDNKILISLLVEIIDNLKQKKIDIKYINFLLNNYNNYYPIINISQIFCFICGENVLLNSFEIHYCSCKAVFERNNPEIKEPEIVNKIIDKLFDDEEITFEELEEYTKKAKNLYKIIHTKKKEEENNNDNIFKRRYKKSKTGINQKYDLKNLFKSEKEPEDLKINIIKKKNSRKCLKLLKKISSDEIKTFKSFFH